MKNQKGITLIALVITIIVLLILAGVSIATISGDDGIVQKAADAKEKTNAVNADEEQKLNDAKDYIDEKVQGGRESGGNGNTLASQIDASNYGDYVNYSKDLELISPLEGEESTPKTDWRIFYKDGDRVYLIAADYVLNSSDLLKVSSAGMETFADRALYWGSVSSELSAIARQDNIFGINESSYVLNETYENSICVSCLLDTDHWKNFVDTTVADYAIGGPTIEMYANSWNGKGYKTIILKIGETGYSLNNWNNSVDMSSDAGYNDNLYYTRKNYDDDTANACYGYWLASPSNSTDLGCDILSVYCDGYVMGNSYDYLNLAVRPVVSLKSGITATQDANGVWQLGE